MKRILLFAAVWMLLATTAVAQVVAPPSLMNFQGRLARPDGTPVANGNYNLQFSLFSAVTGGTLLWQRSLANVPVRNGTFAARLDFTGGFQNSATLASVFGASAVFLEIKVGADAPLTPRQQLLTVAYAMKANSVPDGSITTGSILDATITATDIANGTLTGAKIANGTITADKLADNALGWLLSGNSITDSATQFLGTTSNQPLVFRTNNTEKMRLAANGNLGLGTTTPAEKLDVRGNLTMGTANLPLGLTHEVGGNEPLLNLDANFRQSNKNTAFRGAAFRIDTRDDFPLFQFLARGAGSEEEKIVVGLTESGNLRLNGPGSIDEGGKINFGDADYVYLQEDTDDNLTIQANRTAIMGGNVGIGTSTPEQMLHLVGGSLRVDDGQFQSWGQVVLHPDVDQTGDDIVQFLDSAGSETMRVDYDGFVGINTSNPGYRLTVNQNGNGIVHTNGTVSVATYVQSDGAWLGTLTNHDLTFMTNDSNGWMTITTGGNVGIGTFEPSATLHVSGTLKVSNLPFGDYRNVQWNDATGQFFYDNSSRRHKENITPLQDDFEKLLQAVPVTYTRPGVPGRWEIGFIAEDFDALGLKKLVDYEQDGKTPAGINYEKICLYLTAISKQQAQALKAVETDNKTLKAENAELKARLEVIETALAELKSRQK
jgi:hypothetical protein